MLGDRAGDLLALTFHPGQAGAAQLLRRLGELVHGLARERAPALHGEPADAGAILEGRLEEGHTQRLDLRRPVRDRKAESEIGLARAVTLHGIAPGEPREGARHPVARLVPLAHQHLLDVPDHALDAHERRLQLHLRELRLAVLAPVVVAAAGPDLT